MSYGSFDNNRSLDADFITPLSAYPVSIVAWIKLSATDWNRTDQRIIAYFNDAPFDSGGDQRSTLQMTSTDGAANRVAARVWSDSNTTNFAANDHTVGLYDDLWVVAVAVYEGDASRRMYVEDSTNPGSNLASHVIAPAWRYLRFGSTGTAGFSALRGSIAELAVFDKVLTTAEIDALQTAAQTGVAPNTVAPANCIGYWPLTTDQATHPDQSGNGGPDLTVKGAPVWSADHPTIIGGTKAATVRLADINGVDRANLSQVPWAWYDSLPTTLETPSDTGNGTTDASGNLTVDIPNSTLTTGQVGYLVIDTGAWQGIYAVTVS